MSGTGKFREALVPTPRKIPLPNAFRQNFRLPLSSFLPKNGDQLKDWGGSSGQRSVEEPPYMNTCGV